MTLLRADCPWMFLALASQNEQDRRSFFWEDGVQCFSMEDGKHGPRERERKPETSGCARLRAAVDQRTKGGQSCGKSLSTTSSHWMGITQGQATMHRLCSQ